MAVGFLDGMAVWIREARRPGNEQSPGIIEQEQARALRCLAYLAANTPWQHQPLDYARTCIGITLWRMRYSLPDFDWPGQFPELASWHKRFMAQPELDRTGPPQTS
jgi:glutathione S-transferase